MEDRAEPGTNSEEQLRLCRERMDEVPDWIWELNLDAEFVYSNRVVESILGYSVDEILDELVFGLMAPDDVEKCQAFFESAKKLKTPISHVAAHFHTKDNGIRTLGISCVPICDERGELVKFRCIARDMTDVVDLQRSAQEAVAEREREQTRLQKLNECFLSFGPDAVANINRLTGLAGELMGATAALYSRLDEGMLSSWGMWQTPPGYNPLDRPEGHICYDVIRRGGSDTVVIRNLPETAYFESDPNVKPFGLLTYAGHPVKLGDAVVGSLCCVYQADYVPTESDKRLLSIIASAIAVEELRNAAELDRRRSEQRISTLLETMYTGVLVQDADGVITQTNKAACEILGCLPVEQVIGNRWPNLADGAILEDGSRAPAEHPAMVAHRTGKPVRDVLLGICCERPQGPIWLLVNSEPVIDPDTGESGEVMTTFLDVTERENARREIERLSLRNELVLNAVGEGIFGVDLQGRFTFVNPAAAKMLRYEADELVGQYAHDTIHHSKPDGSNYRADECRMYAAYKDGSMHQVTDEVFWRKDRTGFPVEYVSTPIRENGELVGSVAVFTDITERKRAQAALLEEKVFSDTIIESLPGIFYMLDSQGRYFRWNTAKMELYGLSAEQMWNRDGFADVHEEDRELVAGKIKEVFDKGYAELEARLLTTDGPRYYFLTGRRMDIGGAAYVVGSGVDITERRLAQEALREQMDFAQRVLNSTDDHVAVVDTDGTILEVNAAWRRFAEENGAGDETRWSVGASYFQAYSDEWGDAGRAPEAYDGLRQVQQGKLPSFDIEYPCNSPDQERWFAMRVLPLVGQPGRVLVSHTNQTKRKQAEEALRQSEARWRTLVETINEGFAETDENSVFTYVNPRFEELSGYSLDEIVGRKVEDFLDEPNREILRAQVAIRRTGKHEPYELAWIAKDGRAVHSLVSPRPVFDSEGNFAGSLAAVTDITERKLAEEQLRSRTSELEAVLHAFPDLYFWLDCDGTMLAYHATNHEDLYVPPEQFLGKRVQDIMPDDIARMFHESITRLWETGGAEAMEVQLPFAEGQRTYETRLSLLPDGRIIVAARNVTESVAAEQGLRQLAAIVESSDDAIFSKSLDGIILTWNAGAERIYGYSKDEAVGQSVAMLIPADRKDELPWILDKTRRGESIEHFDTVRVTKDGRLLDVSLTISPTTDENGEIVSASTVARDVTQRKRDEESLRESEERYRRLVDLSPIAIFVNLRGRFAFLNAAALAIFGASTPEDMIGRQVLDFVGPEHRGIVQARIMSMIEGRAESVPPVQESFLRLDGSRIDAEVVGSRITYQGEVALLVMFNDITERVKSEAALRESEETYRNLVEATDTGYLIIDSEGCVVDANPEYVRLTGRRSLEEILGRNVVEWTAKYDLERNAEEVRKCMDTGLVRDLEIDYVSEDGKITPVEINANVIETRDGLRIITLCRDITDRRLTEAALRDSEEQFRLISESATDAIVMIDETSTILYANPATEAIFGYSSDEMVGRKLTMLMPEELRAKHLEGMREFLRTGQRSIPWRGIDLPGRHKSGREVPLEMSYSHFVKEGKRVFIGMIRDITERKRAEEALRLTQFSVDQASDSVFWIERDARLTYVNDAACRSLGYSREELLGMTVFDIDPVLTRERWEHIWSELEQQGSVSVESVHQTKQGKQFAIEVSASYLEFGGRKYNFAFVRDITERKRAEEATRLNEARLEALIRLSQMSEASLQDIADFALEKAVKLTKSTVGYLAFVSEDQKTLTMHAWSKTAMLECAIADKPIVYQVEESGLWAEPLRQRRPVITNDDSAPNPLKRGLPDGHVKLTRHMHIPVFDGERVVAVAGVGNKEDDYDESDVRQMTLLMDGMWRLVQRKEAEEALRNSEERYRLLFDLSPDMVGVIKDGRIIGMNSAVSRILGYSPEEVIGLAPWDISPEFQPDGTSSKDKAMAVMERAIEAGTNTFDWVHQRKDGGLVDCEVSLTAYSAHGEHYVQGILRDVTERKRAEEHRRAYEKQADEQKRLFYRETIRSVTGGKLDICEAPEIRAYISKADLRMDVKNPSEVSQARRDVERFCRDHQLNGERLDSFMIGVGEALTNAVKHAQRGRAYAGASNGSIWFGVADRGTGIESLILPRAILLRGFSTKPSLGLGYTIMLDVADSILLKTGGQGTTVVLVKNLEEPVLEITPDQLPDTWDAVPG